MVVTNGFKQFGEVIESNGKWQFIYNGRLVREFETLFMAKNYIRARYGLIFFNYCCVNIKLIFC